MALTTPNPSPIPLTPAPYDLAIYRGDSYGWRIICWADLNGDEAVDLTGATPTAQVRPGTDAPLDIELDVSVTLPNVIDVSLPPAKSQLVNSGRWDLQLTFPDGSVRTVVAGNVTVTGDITVIGEP